MAQDLNIESDAADHDLFADDLSQKVMSDDRKREPVRTVGRPAGAINRKTLQTARKIITITDPVENLAAVARLPIAEIAKRLSMKMGDAAEFWRKCNNDLAPYAHSKMPTAVNHTGIPSTPVNMFMMAPEHQADGSDALVINPMNSGTYEDADTSVTATSSPHPAKPLEEKGNSSETN